MAERRERSRTKGALESRARAMQRRTHRNTKHEKQAGMYVILVRNPPGMFGAAAVVMHRQHRLGPCGGPRHCVRIVNPRTESILEVIWNCWYLVVLPRATAWGDYAGVRRIAKCTCGSLASVRGTGSGDAATAIGDETGPECLNVLWPRGGVPWVFLLAISRWRSSLRTAFCSGAR